MRLFIAATTVLSLIGFSQALPNPVCQETHQVAKGETCKTIALKFDHAQSDIQQWNKKLNSHFDCNNLKVGDSICVKYASVDKRGEKPEPEPKKPLHHKKPLPKTTTTKKHHALTPSAKAPADLHKRGESEPKKPLHHKKPLPKTTTTKKHHAPAPTPSYAPVPKELGKRDEAPAQNGAAHTEQAVPAQYNTDDKPKKPLRKKTTTLPPKKPYHKMPHHKMPHHTKRGEVKKVAPKKKTTTKKPVHKKHTTVRPKKYTTTKKPVAKKN